jgi:hypothetical protein
MLNHSNVKPKGLISYKTIQQREENIMANTKKVEMTRKEREQIEEKRMSQVKLDYEDYKVRIETRISKGENEQRLKGEKNLLEVLPYERLIRKTMRKDKEGNEIEFEVSGDSGETKNERFKRLGKARMISALDSLDLIINLSAPQYEATPEEVKKMVDALRLKVLDIENSFKAQEKKTETFSF